MATDYLALDVLWILFILGVFFGAPVLVIGGSIWLRKRDGSRRAVVFIGLLPALTLLVPAGVGVGVTFLLVPAGVAGLGVLAYGALIPGRSLTRECPHCRESIRADANVCPRCDRESEPWTFQDERWWRRDGDGWLRLSDVHRDWHGTDRAPTVEPAR